MYKECKEYLIDALKRAGMKRDPITSMKRLKLCGESRVSAVLFDAEQLEKDKQNRVYETEVEGVFRKRKKLLRRELAFKVVIGENSDDAAETIYEAFLGLLEDGLYVDGNYVELQPEGAEWFDEEDSILRAKCSVQLTVRCIGGVYKDLDRRKLTGIRIDTEQG